VSISFLMSSIGFYVLLILEPNTLVFRFDFAVGVGLLSSVMLVRRDVMVQGWRDPWAGEFGVEASNRVWLGCFNKQRNHKDD
jgi:hypothetical protein